MSPVSVIHNCSQLSFEARKGKTILDGPIWLMGLCAEIALCADACSNDRSCMFFAVWEIGKTMWKGDTGAMDNGQWTLDSTGFCAYLFFSGHLTRYYRLRSATARRPLSSSSPSLSSRASTRSSSGTNASMPADELRERERKN